MSPAPQDAHGPAVPAPVAPAAHASDAEPGTTAADQSVPSHEPRRGLGGRTRPERLAYVTGLVGCFIGPALALLSMALATITAPETFRYAATAGWAFVMNLPVIVLMVRVNMAEQRRADALLGALAGRLSEAARTAQRQVRRLDDAQHMAGMTDFEFVPGTGTIVVSEEARLDMGLPPGFSMADYLGRVHPDDQAMAAAALDRCLQEHTPIDHVQRHVRPDGSMRWIHIRAAWRAGEDDHGSVVGTSLDITALKAAEAALHFQTFHDPLTGLANRALFLNEADRALDVAARRKTSVSVMFLDLDDFKMVNDSLGHQAGDDLLIAVARRFDSVTRAGDTLARIGGDEFALLLASGPMPQTAITAANRVAAALRAPFVIDGLEVSVRVSVGIAVAHHGSDASQDLLRDADLAMYLAKQNGKDRVEMVRPGMRDEALNHLALVTDLRHAHAGNEFEVYYQPIVSVQDRTPAGAEALVRWHRPGRGLVPPDDFIGVAESTGLIVPLGEWVLNQACRQAQLWRQADTTPAGFYISVNLSPRQLADPTLIHVVAEALRVSGLPPGALVLEITESTLMHDFDEGLDHLRRLKDLGVRLALDDYGTGYSSLNRLAKLPVDIVKIDKSFIDQLTQGRQHAALVRSIIDVTHALGMISIAEGVESPEQRTVLAQLGCHAIQGYLYAKPLPAGDTTEALQRLIDAARPEQVTAEPRR